MGELFMRPDQRAALENPCRTQEDLQKVWDNPKSYKFSSKFLAFVTLCVAQEGETFTWVACVRLANPKKRNFKSVVLWTKPERAQARKILFDVLAGVGAVLGDEEFNSKKALHYSRRLTADEHGVALAPQILGS